MINDTILHGLQTFNLPFFNQTDCQFFSIYARGENEEILGGLCGGILGKSACVDYAWVKEELRGKGIGTRLFSQLEAFANAKKCRSIQLFTSEFEEPFLNGRGFSAPVADGKSLAVVNQIARLTQS